MYISIIYFVLQLFLTYLSTKSTLLSVDDKGDGRYLLKYEVVMEIEGQEKPAYVAESLSMFIT